MKKVLLIIIGVVCSLNAIALSYASPYKGAGRSGYIHSSAPIRSSMGTRAVMAQAPVAAMSSTSSYGTQYMPSYAGTIETSSNNTQVRGIYTAASAIQGGVTTAETYTSFGMPRKSVSHPGECSHCIDEDDDGSCDKCGMDMMECDEENCTCDVPLDFNWAAALFMTTLAVAYAIYKKGRAPYSDVRNGNEMVTRMSAI